MIGCPYFRCQGAPSLVIAALMLHGALSVTVGQDAHEEQHQIEVAAAGSMLHNALPQRRMVRAVVDMGPPGVAKPSLMQLGSVVDGTVMPDNLTSAQFAFDPYTDGPANVIGQPGPPGHEGTTGHQGTIGNTGKEGHQGSPGSEGHDGAKGKPGHMFHLHGYATRSEVMKAFMLNFTISAVAFLVLLKKLKEKYGPKGHGLEFSLTVVGIEFGKLSAKQDVWHSVTEALQDSVSSQVGITKNEIHITLSDGGGSLMAEVWIDKDKQQAIELAQNLSSLNTSIMKRVTERLTELPGVGDVQADGSTSLMCTSVSPPTAH